MRGIAMYGDKESKITNKSTVISCHVSLTLGVIWYTIFPLSSYYCHREGNYLIQNLNYVKEFPYPCCLGGGNY